MSLIATVDTQVCETYQGLLEECELARQEWNERRTEISELGLRGKGIDDELRRLQARFAKSHAVVGNHLRDCSSCQSARGTDHASDDESHARVFAAFGSASSVSARLSSC
jgi:hypothetical protein